MKAADAPPPSITFPHFASPICKGQNQFLKAVQMHEFITVFFLLWLIPSAQIAFGYYYQAQDPYSAIREDERIYGQQGRRVPPNGVGEESAGQRAEKALGELREGIGGAEIIGVPPHGRQRRESLLGLDVPYKAKQQQQENKDGQLGQQSKDAMFGTKESEKQPPL